jgi:hypothetical protein
MYRGLRGRYLLFFFFSDFNENWIFVYRISKNIHISNFMKISPVGNELFHADGQTSVTKLTVAFRNFTNSPKNSTLNNFHLVTPPLHFDGTKSPALRRERYEVYHQQQRYFTFPSPFQSQNWLQISRNTNTPKRCQEYILICITLWALWIKAMVEC